MNNRFSRCFEQLYIYWVWLAGRFSVGGVPPTNAGPINSCSAPKMGKAGEERDWENHNIWLFDQKYMKDRSRPERWIVTIPSSDQWLATIENHWKTIVSNGCQTTKPLKNHWYQWFSDQKPLENHCYQWFWRLKTIVKPLTSMVAFQPFI